MRFPHARSVKAALIGTAVMLFAQSVQAAEAEVPGDIPLPGRMGDLALKMEPGVALPLTNPQSRTFKTGGGETIKALWVVNVEVVQALNDNKSFRVQVEGHASSEGGDDHNQTLSEKRAEAVLNYLVTHGIDRERLASKGFGSSVPLDTNETIAGRENNRRVEFVVYFTILNDRSK
jgi:hypothetical protein